MSEIEEFISESNAIEGVYDEDSFQQAMYAWSYLMTEESITIPVMLKTHKILMLHQKLYPNEKGYLRTVPVYIGGHEAISHKLIRPQLANLAMNMTDVAQNGKRENKEFLEKLIKDHHVKYEKIHPFVDGNGRTGRMFLNWQRLKVGLPLLIIHEGKEQMEYYHWFK